MSPYKEEPKKKQEETVVIYDIALPKGYTLALKMDEKTAKMLFSGMTSSTKSTADGQEGISPEFIARTLKMLAKKNTNDGTVSVNLSGEQYQISASVTNQKGQGANPQNLADLAKETQTEKKGFAFKKTTISVGEMEGD